MSETTTRRHYWRIMRYLCDKCGRAMLFFLEDGCEGPRHHDAPMPDIMWQRAAKTAPPEVFAGLPRSIPHTADNRVVLPVPFIAAACPTCQPRKPWSLTKGVLQHVDWHNDRNVDTYDVPPDCGVFHYPDDPLADQACGHPILPSER
jgi:hypothetical protein